MTIKRTQDRGKRRTPWYIGYTDHTGRRRTAKGFTDKAETERLAAQLEDEARMIREGLRVPVSASDRKAPLEHHLDAFEEHLRNRDVSPKQVREVTTKIRRVLEGCGFSKVADIKAQAVETYLGTLRKEGISKQTSNHCLRATKQFCRWLKRTKRSEDNPLDDVPMLNVQTDRRHDRRPLLLDEFTLLVAAAEAGPPVESIAGADRAMMYILSALTDFLRYKDSQGRYADFHANRHTFITNLGRVGVHPKTAQPLARHSDIRLTMNVYSHTDLAEKTAAVRRLPGLWECFSWGECAGVASWHKWAKNVTEGRNERTRSRSK